MKSLLALIITLTVYSTSPPVCAITNETISATPPTTYAAPIPPSDILTYKFYCGRVSKTYTLVSGPTDTTRVPISSVIPVNSPDGKYYCTATAISSASGLESDKAAETYVYKSGNLFCKSRKIVDGHLVCVP